MRIDDHWVAGPEGRLFARSWRPDTPLPDTRRPDSSSAEARTPLLLLHDSLGCVALWRDFPERLAEASGHPVVAYDRQGFGRSDPHPGTLATDFVRAEVVSVRAIVAQLGLSSVVLLGHSVGGAMAVAAAAQGQGAGQEPGRCRAVVTVAAQTFLEDLTRDSIAKARVEMRAPDQIERLARYHGDKARWVLDAWTESWLDPAFADWTLDADLAALRCPLLALHGDRDEYGTRVHPESIGRLAGGGAEIVLIDDCGHVPQRERPEVVLRAVCGFLAAHAAPPAEA